MIPISAPSSSLVLVLLVAVAVTVNNGNVEAFSPLPSLSDSRLSGIQSASASAHASSSSTIMYAWWPSKNKKPSPTPSQTPKQSSSRPAFLEQVPGESDAAYFKRLSQTASDPIAFAKMALGDQQKDDIHSPSVRVAEATKEVVAKNSCSSSKEDNTDSTVIDDKKRQRGYQRAEEWEADQAKEQKKMSWEERVQYDGQQHGNKFNQNEILRRNLHR